MSQPSLAHHPEFKHIPSSFVVAVLPHHFIKHNPPQANIRYYSIADLQDLGAEWNAVRYCDPEIHNHWLEEMTRDMEEPRRHLRKIGLENVDIDAVDVCRDSGRLNDFALEMGEHWIETAIVPLVEQAKRRRLARAPAHGSTQLRACDRIERRRRTATH
ncbi:hypothetical protein OF83DRAFT_1179759 [Amylostereum chailletii]|nr:hypothetical protein OF83DRAFT_1179759 [Amylostereum chailletii]